MPPVPEWLADLFRQFPVVALVLATGAVTARWVDARRQRDLELSRRDAQDTKRWAEGEVAQARAERDEVKRELAAERAKCDKLQTEYNRYIRSQQRAAERRARPEGE